MANSRLIKMADSEPLNLLVFASGHLHVPQIPHIKGIEKVSGRRLSTRLNRMSSALTSAIAKLWPLLALGGSAIQYIS